MTSQASRGDQMMRCPNLSDLPSPRRGKKGWPWTEETAPLPDTMSDGQPWPRVTIVTPSYNQAQFVEEAIRSVLLQGYPNLEYTVIDGGSTDGSVEIIKKYEKWLTYWVSEPDRGQSHAINKGFEKASGVIYGWLNSDDYLLKDALKSVARAYLASPESGAWCGSSLYVDVNGKKTGVREPPPQLDAETIAAWNENSFAQPATFFSRRAWQQCAPLDENLQYGMDLDLWIRIAQKFAFEKMGEVLATERLHKDCKTEKDMGMMYAVQCQIQIRHGYERLAMEDIRQWMNEYTTIRGKLDRISRLPVVRLFRPIALIVWRKLQAN